MCRTSTKITKMAVPRLLSVLAVAVATIALSGAAHAQVCQHGLSCQIGVAGPDGNFNNPRAHIGDTINIVITAANSDTCGDSLSITSIVAVVRHQGGASPSSSGNLLGAPATLPNLGDSVTVNHTDVVQSGDQPVLIVATDIRGIDQGTTLPVTATCEAPIAILVPCIEVTKRCLDASAPGQLINFDGTVTNCGNTTLNNVTVVDDHAGTVLTLASLAAGASATYSGSYIPTTCPSTNTVRAEGTDALGLTVSDTDSATCSIMVRPNIQISKVCVFNSATGRIDFNGTVTNTGDVPLENVTVVDDHAGTVLAPTTLAAGASVTYSGSYTPTTCPSTNTATVNSDVAPPFENCIGGDARPTDSASATCGIPGTPSIDVTKECRLIGDCDDPDISFNGTVTNTGDLDLQNVTVRDDNGTPGNTGDDVTFNIGFLARGASATFAGTYTAVNNPSVNTVVATGISVGVPACGGEQTVTDTAQCSVPIAGVPCIDVTKVCELSGSTVNFNGTVTNCGTDITLVNVTVTDDHAGPVFGPATLAPGQSATYSGSYSVTIPPCPFDVSFTDVVTARGEDRTICALPFTGGLRVVTDMATCTVTTNCVTECITRTPGYWFTHWRSDNANCATLKKAIDANGGVLDLGFIQLPTRDRNGNGGLDAGDTLWEALGIFWKKRTLTGENGGLQSLKLRASPLCRARKQLAFHLIAAIANVQLLGTSPAGCPDPDGGFFPANLIEQAQAAAAGCDVAAIRAITEQLDQFNNSGDDEAFPSPLTSCKADPNGAKSVARDPTTQSNCNNSGCP
jgi:uncharacterized repeat protein (TIGR01451 family)